MMIAVFNPEGLGLLFLDSKALLIQGNGHNCRDAQQRALAPRLTQALLTRMRDLKSGSYPAL